MFWLINLYIAHCNFVDLKRRLRSLERILIFPAWFPDSDSLAQRKEHKINAGEHKSFSFHHRNTLGYKTIWRQWFSQQKSCHHCSRLLPSPPAQPSLPQHPPWLWSGTSAAPRTNASAGARHCFHSLSPSLKVQAKDQQPSAMALCYGSGSSWGGGRALSVHGDGSRFSTSSQVKDAHL